MNLIIKMTEGRTEGLNSLILDPYKRAENSNITFDTLPALLKIDGSLDSIETAVSG